MRVGTKIRCVVSASLVLTASTCQALPAATALLTEARATELRQEPTRWAPLLADCARELSARPTPVAVIEPGPRYTDSGVKSDPATGQISKDSRIAYRASLCYQLSGDDRYARHAQMYIDAWASTVREVNNQQGRNLINFYVPPFVLAAMTVRGVDGWTGEKLRKMLIDVALPVSNSASKNNHGNWGVLFETTAAAFLQDKDRLASAAARWESILIDEVDADGSLPRETCRSATSNWCGGPDKGIRGMAYTHYTLLPTAVAAELLEKNGVHVLAGKGGDLLKKAYAKAAFWTQNPSKFPYYDSNGGALQDVRNASYFYLLQTHFGNADAAATIAQGQLGGDAFELQLLFGR